MSRPAPQGSEMLFLLNLVVFTTQARPELPKGLESLQTLGPAGVLKAGVQLFEKHPNLETARPDMAKWFCTLIAEKFPNSSGAIIRPKLNGGGYEACVAEVPFTILAKLYKRQKQGEQIPLPVFQQVWAGARLIA